MVYSNEVTERFATKAFIFAWAVVFCILQWIGAYTKTTNMQDRLNESAAIIEGYKEELTEYQSLLDTEIDKTAQLSGTIDDLHTKLSDIEKELAAVKEEKTAVENEKAEFEEQHKDCRPPIGYSQDNVLTPSNVTEEELKVGLLHDLKRYAGCFVEMEEKYGINAIFLSSVAALESGWCRTDLAVKNNNLFGYKNASGNGFRYFSSKEESINTVAKHLKNNYLTEGGEHYNGLSVADINIKYCEQSDWCNKVGSIANGIIERIMNT